MKEDEIKDEIARLVSLIICDFEKEIGLLKTLQANKMLSNYINTVEKACVATKEKFVIRKENIDINDFLRTGDPFHGLSNINWLYKENYEPRFYMLFPSRTFSNELDILREKLMEKFQIADIFFRKTREEYNYIQE